MAAANALSDVYAMGGTPLIALNLVAWSLDEIGGDALREVLRGGGEVAPPQGSASPAAIPSTTGSRSTGWP